MIQYDEKLYLGFSKVCEYGGWIGYKIGQKWGFAFGKEGSDWNHIAYVEPSLCFKPDPPVYIQ